MQLPAVSITMRYPDGEAVYSNLSVISVGYAVHQAWVFATLFNTSSFFGDTFTAIASPAGEQPITVVYISSIITYLLTLLIMGVKTDQTVHLLESRRAMTVFGCIACVGTLATFLAGPTFPFGLAMSIVAGVFTGIGSAAGIEYWGYVYAQEFDASSLLNTAVSLPITMLLFSGILVHLPYPVGGIVLSVLPLVEITILWRILPSRDVLRMRMDLGKTLPVQRRKLIMRLGVPLFFCGFAVGYLRNSSMAVGGDVLSGNAGTILIVVSCIAAVLLLAIFSLMGRGELKSWDTMFQVCVAIAFIAVIFAPELLNASDSIASHCILSFGYFCFGSFLWAFYASISQNYRISPVLVFGIGRGIAALSATLISVAPVLAEAYWTPFLSNGYAYISLVLLTLAVGFVTMPNQNKLTRLVGRDPVNASCLAVVEVPRAASVDEELTYDAQEGEAAPASTAASEPAATEPAAPPVAAAPAASPAAPEPAAAPEASPAPLPASAQLQSSMATGLSTEMLYNGCEAVSSRFLLSQRETEVLLLLALGRNSSYIQKTLYISEGTAKTHIRHIYRKTGVHKQQELIDLVEEAAQQ